MAAQNNPGNQYDKTHAITLIAAVALVANRFVAYDGNYATSAGGVKDMQGVTEHAADAGAAVTAITGYSALVEAGGDIALFDYVKPGTSGKVIAGAVDEHCGRALGAAADGQLVEVQLVKHQHADVEV